MASLKNLIDVFHGGVDVPTNKLKPLTFFSDDPDVAKGYLEMGSAGGIGKVHKAKLDIKNPAKDEDVLQAAKELGIYSPYENAQQYLTPEVYGHQSTLLMNKLQEKGFDGAHLSDISMEGSPIKSWVPFSSSQMLPSMVAAGGLSRLANEYLDQPMNMGPDVARVAKETGIQPMSRGEALKNAISAIPGIGDALAAAEGLQGAAEGDWAKAGLGALAAAPMVGAIKTYHMTPHTFDKFDLSKAKTGLGGMMHGRGVYTVDNPEHAAEWIGQLSKKSKPKAKILNVDLRWPDPIKEASTPLSPEDYLNFHEIIQNLPKQTQSSIFNLINSNPELISKWNKTFIDSFSKETFPHRLIGPIIKNLELEQELSNIGIPGFKVGFDSTDYITFDPRYTKINK